MKQGSTTFFVGFIFLVIGCGHAKTFSPDSIDNIELIQVEQTFHGEEIFRTKLDNRLVTDFLNDFNDKNEEIVKFYGCYEIKIHLKNGQFINYRTNGEQFEKLKDTNTDRTYFKLNKNINLVTKYWGIPQEEFCNIKASGDHSRGKNIPEDAF